MQIARKLGLPDWYASTVVEGCTDPVVPRIGLSDLPAMLEQWGHADSIHIALALSGQHLCIIEYPGHTHHVLSGWRTLDFIALWNPAPHPLHAFAHIPAPGAEEDFTLTLWLECTAAAVAQYCDPPEDRTWRISQYNGTIITDPDIASVLGTVHPPPPAFP